jgi:hypothetical protein
MSAQDVIAHNLNAQWGRAHAQEVRRVDQRNRLANEVHTAFCRWHWRKYGRPAPALVDHVIEFPAEFYGWADRWASKEQA